MMYLVFDVMHCEWHGNGTGTGFLFSCRACSSRHHRFSVRRDSLISLVHDRSESAAEHCFQVIGIEGWTRIELRRCGHSVITSLALTGERLCP